LVEAAVSVFGGGGEQSPEEVVNKVWRWRQGLETVRGSRSGGKQGLEVAVKKWGRSSPAWHLAPVRRLLSSLCCVVLCMLEAVEGGLSLLVLVLEAEKNMLHVL
jgi:hypothetical protein